MENAQEKYPDGTSQENLPQGGTMKLLGTEKPNYGTVEVGMGGLIILAASALTPSIIDLILEGDN